MIFDKERKTLELDREEARKIQRFLEIDPKELGPEVSDFVDRLQLATIGVHRGRAGWEELKVSESTRFKLSERDNLEISQDELGVLYQGLQTVLDMGQDSSRAELAVEVRDGIADLMTNYQSPGK